MAAAEAVASGLMGMIRRDRQTTRLWTGDRYQVVNARERLLRPPAPPTTASAMDLMYFDESGDDGLRSGSSRFLVLTSIRIAAEEWIRWNETILALRKELDVSLGIPLHHELHTRNLLLRKACFADLKLGRSSMIGLIEKIGALTDDEGISIRSIAIDKRPGIRPLNIALIAQLNGPFGRCVSISDRGRVPRMRKLISTAFRDGTIAAAPPEFMLEIDSRDSSLVQLADFFATAAYLRACVETKTPTHGSMNQEEVLAMARITEGANRTYHLVRP